MHYFPIDHALENGFHIISGKDRPPKIYLNGYVFYSNARFGDLAKFGKAFLDGKTLQECRNESGIGRERARKFIKTLRSLGIERKCECGWKYPHKGACKWDIKRRGFLWKLKNRGRP